MRKMESAVEKNALGSKSFPLICEVCQLGPNQKPKILKATTTQV